MDEVSNLMIEQLRDAYSAEKQALRGMQKMMRNSTNQKLKAGFQMHIEQTETHIERVTQALEQLGGKPGRKVCEAMRGLMEEAENEMGEHDKGAMMDVVIIAAAQRVEHYEIAAYGTMVTLAKSAGLTEIGNLLSKTLAEEKQTDEQLTQVAVSEVNPAWLAQARPEGAKNESSGSGSRRKTG